MRLIQSASTWLAVGGVLFAIGCEHSSAGEPVVGTAPSYGATNKQSAATDKVVDELTEARCAHEQRCNNIGNGRKYATYEVCNDQVRGGAANDLNAYNCPRGIDQAGLNRCLASLEGGDCNLSFNRVSQIVDCRAGNMCMK
jgi:hypothetical protein